MILHRTKHPGVLTYSFSALCEPLGPTLRWLRFLPKLPEASVRKIASRALLVKPHNSLQQTSDSLRNNQVVSQLSRPFASMTDVTQPAPEASKMLSTLDQQANNIDKSQKDTDCESLKYEDEVCDEDEDESDDEIEHSNLAADFFNSLNIRTTDISKAGSLASITSFTAFKSFWRDHLNTILTNLESTKQANLPITSPPLKALNIETLDNENPGAHECPCCLDPAVIGNARVEIRCENGITRKVFLEALRDQLYGEHVAMEKLRLSERHLGRLVLREFEYMRQGDDEAGNEVFYWSWEHGERTIWLKVSDGLVNQDAGSQWTATARL